MISAATIILRVVSYVLVAAGLIVAVGADVKHRLIPNASALAVLIGGVVLRVLYEPRAMWLSAAIAAVIYVLLVAMVHASIIGGGDAKLATAATFLVPATQVPMLFIDISITGGLLSIVYLVAKRARLTSEPMLPFGVAISGGAAYRMVMDLCSR